MTVVLVGGGSRSGKSAYAQQLAMDCAGEGRPYFVATAMVSEDDELADRVQRHRDDRGDAFDTIEEPLELAATIRSLPDSATVLVDCLTIWLANVMFADATPDFDAVIAAARQRHGHTIFVSNEVGEGIVPMEKLSRDFRDLSGFMNQAFAKAADSVVYLRFGIPQKLK